jgi:DNA polymerase-3 subunit chi
MQVDFYQLTRDPAEKILPVIAQRVLDDHGRLLIVSDDRAQLFGAQHGGGGRGCPSTHIAI